MSEQRPGGFVDGWSKAIAEMDLRPERCRPDDGSVSAPDDRVNHEPESEVSSEIASPDDRGRAADFLALSETVLAWSSLADDQVDDPERALDALRRDRDRLAAQVVAFERDWQGNPAAIVAGLQVEVARLTAEVDGSAAEHLACAEELRAANARVVELLTEREDAEALRAERDRAESHASRAEKIAAWRQVQIDDLTLQLGAVQAEVVRMQVERDRLRALVAEQAERAAANPTSPEIRRLPTGAVDEIVARGVDVHLEMMDRDFVWLGIYGPGGDQLHVDVTAVIPPRRKRPVIRIVTSADPAEEPQGKAKRTRSKR